MTGTPCWPNGFHILYYFFPIQLSKVYISAFQFLFLMESHCHLKMGLKHGSMPKETFLLVGSAGLGVQPGLALG